MAQCGPWTPGRATRARIPRGIWMLGFVSLFMDVSSEMIHGLLPLCRVGVLGASALAVGWIEGIAEATASITKLFSGTLSGWLGRRKPLALAGYALAAFSKPVFPLAPTLGWVIAARFVDRVGKGIRGAPRDALVADFAPPQLLGASFGLRQTRDTIGAFAARCWPCSPWRSCTTTSAAFSGSPCCPRSSPSRCSPSAFRSRTELRPTKRGAPDSRCASCADSARATSAMNRSYALSSYPAGALADRVDRTRVLALACAVLVASGCVLAASSGLAGAALGVALFGLHLGLSQGLLAALVAEATPSDLRGTAFGVFHLVTGLALLAASPFAGWLWDTRGPGAAFAAGAVFAMLAGFACTLARSR